MSLSLLQAPFPHLQFGELESLRFGSARYSILSSLWLVILRGLEVWAHLGEQGSRERSGVRAHLGEQGSRERSGARAHLASRGHVRGRGSGLISRAGVVSGPGCSGLCPGWNVVCV